MGALNAASVHPALLTRVTMLTQQHVRRLFDYDPLTGVLLWRIRRGRMHVGMRAGVDAYSVTGKPLTRKVRIDYQGYGEAQVIWLWMTGVWPTHEVDHKDNDPFNNKWNNLRAADDSQNSSNRLNCRPGRLKWTRKHRSSGKYWAYVKSHGQGYYIGTFDTEQEAHNAAYAVAQQLHGQFVRRS